MLKYTLPLFAILALAGCGQQDSHQATTKPAPVLIPPVDEEYPENDEPAPVKPKPVRPAFQTVAG